jgi:hypothetical protein
VEWVKALQECVEKAVSNERMVQMANIEQVICPQYFHFISFCDIRFTTDQKNGPVTAETLVSARCICREVSNQIRPREYHIGSFESKVCSRPLRCKYCVIDRNRLNLPSNSYLKDIFHCTLQVPTSRDLLLSQLCARMLLCVYSSLPLSGDSGT